MGDTVFKYEYIEGGHVSFAYGKDMSYWQQVMDILNDYQQVESNTKFLQKLGKNK